MKRKNILKFISLLGIGSFVSLAVASCGQVATPNPEPPKPVEPSNPTNPNDDAAKQLADAKSKLTQLISSKDADIAKYDDYAKIKDTLTSAYATAQAASTRTDASLADITSATQTLQTAINKAASDKNDFNTNNQALVTAYNELKTTLQNQSTVLQALTDPQYEAIKNHINGLYEAGTAITTKTLDPSTGEKPTADNVTSANNNIKNAIADSSLGVWKENANKLLSAFDKNALSKEKLTSNDASNSQTQPSNYSFVAFSGDLTTRTRTGSANIPNWNFAQRKVWTSEPPTGTGNGSTYLVENPATKTDVSWIYNLTGTDTKYTLQFSYYGAPTAYLYFPYKLAKPTDNSNVGLQYKLNEGQQQEISFASQSGEDQANANVAPTIDDIKVAKITLSNLNFGQNTIEFSIPAEGNKVAPMIGNMYITSNDQNTDKVYDDIFGNTLSTENDSKAVTVNLLTGYSLAAGYSTYVGEFKKVSSTGEALAPDAAPIYLVGFIGGSNIRVSNGVTSQANYPYKSGTARTLTIYVNAPDAGQYYISGSYLTQNSRNLKLSSSGDNNSVTITNLHQANWTTLGNFNTSDETNTQVENGSDSHMHRTLTLTKGLNKIVIEGATGSNGGDAPFIGNLTFTLSKSNQTE